MLSFFVLLAFGFHGFHQALVLTHEEASATEKFPYLSVMLRPMQAEDEDAGGAGRPLLVATQIVVRLTGRRSCDAAVAPIHL